MPLTISSLSTESREIEVTVAGGYVSADSTFKLDVGTLQLAPSTALAVVGLSGSGKTTLVRVLAGTLGEARFAPLRPKIAAVLHEPLLFRWSTIEQSIWQEQRARRYPFDHAQFAALLAQYGLQPSIISMRPWEISHGMRQRVEIAKSLAFKPDLLLLDEAFTGIDNRHKDAVIQSLDEAMQRSGMRIVFITHDLRDVLRLADRAIVLRDGALSKTITFNESRASRLAPNVDLLRTPAANELVSALFG